MKTIDDLSKEEREEYLNDYSSATIEHFLMRKKMYEDFKKYSNPLTNIRNNIMIKNDVKELQKILDYDLKHSTYNQLNEIYKENLSYFAKKQIELNKIDAGRYFHIFTHMRHNIQKEIDLYQDLLFLLKIDSFIYDDRKRSEERVKQEILEKTHKEYFSINHNRPDGGEIKKIYDDFYGNLDEKDTIRSIAKRFKNE